jgi:PAS domain S-box-containing protein
MRDVTLLTERIHLMELVNDATIDCIMVFDVDLHAIYWNRTSEIITGVKNADALGRYFFDLFPEFIESREINNALIQTLRGRKSFVPYEKGSYNGGYHEHHFVPLKSDTGEVLAVLDLVHDVAHRVKVEKELKSLNRSLVKKNKELKHTNAELVSFSHITSCDLKEPLNRIYSLLEATIRKDAINLSETGKSNLKQIQAAAQRMRLLTDDLAAYCRINTEKVPLSVVNLNHIVLLAVSNLQDEIQAKAATIEHDELPAIKAYQPLLVTLFQHILANAIKFQPKGNRPEIRITTEVLDGEDILHPDTYSDMQYIRISFKDNGIGFNQKSAEEIFQMFYRINPQSFPGTGIGLTVCKKIADLHNGFMTADSSEMKGCTVNVFLPLGKK